MKSDLVLVKKEEHIGKLILNNPEKLNAITGDMREKISRALEEFSQDEHLRIVIITGAGKGFCSGGDVRYLSELIEKKNWDELRSLLLSGRKIVTLIADMPKPVIAAVNGPAAGAGLNLAIACDIRLASDKAVFGASFSKIGIHPDWGGSWLLPRLIGPSRACELVFTGEMIDAKEACRIGLVNHVYPHENFENEVARFASLLSHRPQKAMALAKQLLWESSRLKMEETLEKEIENQMACFQSADAWEGIHAFLEKRKPLFAGS